MNPVILHMYGITNCSTVKKAREWLTQQDAPYAFYDFKKNCVSSEQLTAWAHTVGWETLLNRRGATWRQLTETRKARVVDTDSAVVLMQESPSVIKRPVLLFNDSVVYVGFDSAAWNTLLKNL